MQRKISISSEVENIYLMEDKKLFSKWHGKLHAFSYAENNVAMESLLVQYL